MSYYDERKKKYVINSDKKESEFTDKPGFMDYVKEAFEPANTKAQLEALRKRRQSKND